MKVYFLDDYDGNNEDNDNDGEDCGVILCLRNTPHTLVLTTQLHILFYIKV